MAGSKLTDQLALMAAHFGPETAFVDLGGSRALSFADWDGQANGVARGLARIGVGRGDRVAIDVSADHPLAWVVAYAAIHKAGAVAVPINTRWVAAEVRAALDHAGVSVVVADGPTLERVAESLAGPRRIDGGPQARGVHAVVAVDVTERPFPQPLLAWDDLIDDDRSAYQVDLDDDEVADIVYTSGTTGRPKGVVVRHANASLLPTGVPTWSGAGWLTCSPLFTFAGITFVYNPMKLGMTALYLPRFDPAAWIAAVEEHHPAMVFLVPAMAELLLAHPDFGHADLSSIGLCAVGSAPLAPQVQRRLQARMPAAAVSNAYGMTEAGPAFTILPKEETERRAGSVGRPLPPAEFFVVGPGGERLPQGEVGELVIHLPGRAREYYRDPQASAQVWQGDGLHTGDLARIDEDGYVYVVGRTKEVIIRGGNNVYAADVEAVLYEHPDVVEAAVAGVPHPMLGEDVAAWVVARAGSPLEPADVRAWAAERLADYKVPRRVVLVDSLPRNATGKVVKSELTLPDPVIPDVVERR
ncbi:MAG: acyl--CoA ligase [Acidimicrobiaceae bacterium]|nr:acyl--CoA ligase [Acidimicrobiaceae bacterium]MBO0747243.1 acyl--CoA ligase [Acidimicrobiaceae bacterium]